MTAAIAVAVSVALLVGGALKGLAMVLAFKATKLEHAPLVEMQAKLDALEQRILGQGMQRR